jgi:tRNA threonylcarbamoyladenosine biosynthesis protein TsaB
MLLLGIDTCGPTGSAALGRLAGDAVEVIAQTELAGRTYSATLVSAVEELLMGQKIGLRDIGCVVVVNGPGSFTGVRVGLSAAKGLAEGGGIPVVAVSRLEVLARKAGVYAAALDAHRHELFLRIADPEARELLAGAEDLARLNPPLRIAVCDDPAAALLEQAWPAVRRVQVAPPTAADAFIVVAPAIAVQQFADAALLDGHYLRRSDAEIFGNTVTQP